MRFRLQTRVRKQCTRSSVLLSTALATDTRVLRLFRRMSPLVLLRLLLLAAVCQSLVGCSQPGDLTVPPPPTAVPSPTCPPILGAAEEVDPTGKKISLWHCMTGIRQDTLLQLAAQFTAENPYDITVRVEFHRPLAQEVQDALAAGSPPDLLITECEDILALASLQAVAPIDALMDDPAFGLSHIDRLDVRPFANQGACTDPRTLQPMGLPFDPHLVLMFRNAEWAASLEQAPPETWEQFRVQCNAGRNEALDKWGWVAATDGSLVANWIAGLGGQVLDPSAGEAFLDSPEAIATLSVLRDLLLDNCASCRRQVADALGAFTAEKSLFSFGTSGNLAEVSAAASFLWDILPVPHLTEEPVVTLAAATVSVLATSSSQQTAAWLFARSLLQPRSDATWAVTTGAMPLCRSTVYVPAMQEYMEANPQYGAAVGLLDYAQPEPAVEHWSRIRTLLGSAAQYICSGARDPSEALASADSAAQELLAN
jgi:multiple sugar transport system substrate-binding protein